MKIEKLNEDKIRITLDINDLKEKNIDFHSFMSNSISAQSIFMDMLKKAEKEVGFITKNYKTMIEAFATSDGNFILTITRIQPEIIDKDLQKKKKMKIKRKSINLKNDLIIFKFNTFDEYCDFCISLTDNYLNQYKTIIKTSSLYSYNSKYYLILNNISNQNISIIKFYSYISEFAELIHIPNLMKTKLLEYGKIVMKKNAINNCIKHFPKK